MEEVNRSQSSVQADGVGDLSKSGTNNQNGFGGPPRTTNPPPPPPPPLMPNDPPIPGSDFICTHATGSSTCRSRDARVDIDYMERVVRTQNPYFKKYANLQAGVICLPGAIGYSSYLAGYPLNWICATANYSYARWDIAHEYTTTDYIDNPANLFQNRILAGARPAEGYRSYKHFDAPFRCLGAFGIKNITYTGTENEFQVITLQRDKMTCYFKLDQVTPDRVADAMAEAEDFNTLEGAKFTTKCLLKAKAIGQNQSLSANVLECSYTLEPPPGSPRLF